MPGWITQMVIDPYSVVAAWRRWWFDRPLFRTRSLGRPLTETEMLYNISRSTFGDDRLLERKD
jgi:hypothetical protein